MNTKVRRLHVGASRLENLTPAALKVFSDASWVHLGDAAPTNGNVKRPAPWHRFLRHRRPSAESVSKLYSQSDFRPFYFESGDTLPFPDGTFDFVYSEHFIEHLFFHEAVDLLRECHRTLRPGGVVRTCVPDADLRTYEPPESVGFPGPKLDWNAPLKHKTRWSVYMLGTTLELLGFETVPLHYCDRQGRYLRRHPRELADRYARCPEPDLLFDLSYVMRPDSLLMDGIRR